MEFFNLALITSRIGVAAATSLIAGFAAAAAGSGWAGVAIAAAVFGIQAYGALRDYATATAANEDALRQEASKCLYGAKKASNSAIARARNDLNSQVPRTNFRTARDYLMGRGPTTLFPPLPGQPILQAAGRAN